MTAIPPIDQINPPKLCKDCRFAFSSGFYLHGDYLCAKSPLQSVVDGKRAEAMHCLQARLCSELCGLEGKLWEPKP